MQSSSLVLVKFSNSSVVTQGKFKMFGAPGGGRDYCVSRNKTRNVNKLKYRCQKSNNFVCS